MISEAEKQQRRDAVESSTGSLAAESMKLDVTMVELSRRYAEGEISLSEFGRLTDIHLSELGEIAKAEEFAAVA